MINRLAEAFESTYLGGGGNPSDRDAARQWFFAGALAALNCSSPAYSQTPVEPIEVYSPHTRVVNDD